MELLAPRAVAALGAVIPHDLPRLRQVQEMARAGQVPWPDGWGRSPEALTIANIIAGAPAHELSLIGRNAARVNDYAAVVERRTKLRARRAAEREAYMAARHRRGHGRDAALLAEVMTPGRTADHPVAIDRQMRRRP